MKLFISHASEDKDAVARPLAHALRELGYNVWFDEFTLKVGDSLRRSIDGGLATCDFGVVILSPGFFAKEWPQKELDALTARETTGSAKVILPVWHNIDAPSIARVSPTLADKLGISTQLGIAKVIASLRDVLGSPDDQEEVTHKNFIQWSTKKWITAQQQLFPGSIPASSSWTRLEDIARIMNTISIPSVNHMYTPEGGGMDMDGASTALEDGCIEVEIGRRAIWLMKPKELQFESFPPYFSMSYFRLETEEIRPTGVYDDLIYDHEELVEVEPLNYLERSVWDEGGTYDSDGDLIRLPDESRLVIRWFKGTFLIANKGSLFNHLHGKYDPYSGRYSKMERAALKGFIKELIDAAVEKNAMDE
jgi:hypothetical protein